MSASTLNPWNLLGFSFRYAPAATVENHAYRQTDQHRKKTRRQNHETVLRIHIDKSCQASCHLSIGCESPQRKRDLVLLEESESLVLLLLGCSQFNHQIAYDHSLQRIDPTQKDVHLNIKLFDHLRDDWLSGLLAFKCESKKLIQRRKILEKMSGDFMDRILQKLPCRHS